MQRRRLLSAFAEVLADEGLEAAGVGRVCARASVSRRTFYYLFDDREDCFLAAFDAAVERISASVLVAYSDSGRWRERMRSGLAALLGLLDEEPGLVSVCLIETLKGGPAVQARRAHVIDVLAGAVDEGRADLRAAIGPAPLTAESVVGGAVSVICARFAERERMQSEAPPLSELLNPLMSMIVQPYLGRAAARRELEHRTLPPQPASGNRNGGARTRHVSEPFKGLSIRITFRTARVLATIAAAPGASNREVADAAGVADQGQMSKLLSRLEGSGLIENRSPGHEKGEPNAWRLTARGEAVQRAIELP